jgi:1-acyl-sn-glycerol-3-phosphate acyltransferase
MADPDPLAYRSATLLWLFGWYLRWYFYRRFHAVRISRAGYPALPAGKPVVIYSNHPSWWDPALYILVGTKLMPGRIGYGPMDARALRSYRLMRRMGVFGIDSGHARGAAEFLHLSRRVLEQPKGILWVTAEGQFTDARKRPVCLRPGIAHLARHMPGIVLLPLAIEYSFWNESRPEALVRFGTPIESGRQYDIPGWTALLADELSQTMDALAGESMTRDPDLFERLLAGSAGVGGLYDVWRRARAWGAGRRFEPAHGQPPFAGPPQDQQAPARTAAQ